MSNTQSSSGLEQGLKPRHVTMLSIAGVIGAGLFVGSGHAIAQAGPAVLLAYAAAMHSSRQRRILNPLSKARD